ncbi:antibiotic biosynthesis monooxygenase family protein [Staphylococcus sp. 17KM0847]|uniref:antibiotic biosynthesis monooxygenase family protein n=1 Tax=Staphylococcus sp. 17KM0847 TaxID=2583989 RepID=UPI0015DCFB0A|nr:antibiotic biosynthesis monooxygenase family protein [Staphylococcus sp. 17KM0847]QLK86333.1 signal transduction protein TRAP [Staphylococcus sp. 17KM0847]
MNFYITYGTFDFLRQIQQQHQDRHMLIFSGDDQSIIIDETNQETRFQQPNSYRVLTSVGTIDEAHFQILITIPTTEDHQYQLEKQLENYVPKVDQFEGFCSYRLLKPKNHNIYKVLLGFTSRPHYEDYKKSSAFRKYLSYEATKPLAGASNVHANYLEKYFYPVTDEI